MSGPEFKEGRWQDKAFELRDYIEDELLARANDGLLSADEAFGLRRAASFVRNVEIDGVKVRPVQGRVLCVDGCVGSCKATGPFKCPEIGRES